MLAIITVYLLICSQVKILFRFIVFQPLCILALSNNDPHHYHFVSDSYLSSPMGIVFEHSEGSMCLYEAMGKNVRIRFTPN